MQDFFSYYIRQQTILADVTVGCQSNGRRVSSISDLLAPAAKSSAGGTACSRLPWPAMLPCRPQRPLLLPPLARASLYSPTPPVILRRRLPHIETESVNPRTPLCVGLHCILPRLRAVPFLGLAVVHRPGALGAAWSTWSRNDFHRMWTVCGEADSWVHGRSKEVPPYYAQNNYSST